MMSFDLDKLIRPHIKSLVPYSSARDEHSGSTGVFLDANENSFGSPTSNDFSRYPDPYQSDLKRAISGIKGVPQQYVFLGNGSDEIIDLLIRIFCVPSKDSIVICPPTYGMYAVCARAHDVGVVEIPLSAELFGLDVDRIKGENKSSNKLLFLCSPNNPTANSLERESMLKLIESWHGIVVIDEAYINYSAQRSLISELVKFPNLIVLQTLSKAWGLAALRLGMCFASAEIIKLLNTVKPPYNVSGPAQQWALEALENLSWVNKKIRDTITQRERLVNDLALLRCVKKIYPSDTNFLLIKFFDATSAFNFLKEKKIIVRDRSSVVLCDQCLRITIGNSDENTELLAALKEFDSK